MIYCTAVQCNHCACCRGHLGVELQPSACVTESDVSQGLPGVNGPVHQVVSVETVLLILTGMLCKEIRRY